MSQQVVSQLEQKEVCGAEPLSFLFLFSFFFSFPFLFSFFLPCFLSFCLFSKWLGNTPATKSNPSLTARDKVQIIPYLLLYSFFSALPFSFPKYVSSFFVLQLCFYFLFSYFRFIHHPKIALQRVKSFHQGETHCIQTPNL